MKVIRRFALAAVLSCCCAPIRTAALDYVEGEVIVTFKPSMTSAAARQAVEKHSFKLTRNFAELSRSRGRQFGVVKDKMKTTAELIAELGKDPAIERVETNYLRKLFSAPPNDSYFGQLWGLKNSGANVNGVLGASGDDIHGGGH